MSMFDFMLIVGIAAFVAVLAILGLWIMHRDDFYEIKNAVFIIGFIVFILVFGLFGFDEIRETKYNQDVFESEPFLSELEEWAGIGYDEGYHEGYSDGYDDGYEEGYDEGYEKGKKDKKR